MNLFIPCFGMMYSILAAMNGKVCSLEPFSDNGYANDWIPQGSVIVYSILAIIQVFRAQTLLHGAADAEQSLFLSRFLDTCVLQNIVIPGPLVPFFRSLSISRFGGFKTVGPGIPNISYSEERLYAMDYVIPGTETRFTGIDLMIPHVPLMLDQFRLLLIFLLSNDVNGEPNRYSAYTQLSTIFGLESPVEGSPHLPRYQRLLHSLGFTSRPYVSNGHMARFAQFYSGVVFEFPGPWTFNEAHAPVVANAMADPPMQSRAAKWVNYESLSTCLGFEDSTGWFHSLLRGLPTFTQHFKGNVRLSDISPTSSTAAMIRFKEVSYEALPAKFIFGRAKLNNASHHLVFYTYGVSSCSTIPSKDFEDAQMALVNVNCTYAFNNELRIGDLNVTHFGDFWHIHPDVTYKNPGELTHRFMSLAVSPDYFQEKN